MKITHDLHIHTNLSLCAKPEATLDYYVQKAKELGLKKIGISNHYAEEGINICPWYDEQNYAHVSRILPEIEKYNNCGIEILYGCECEYSPEYGAAITEKTAEMFDYILVPNSHTHMVMPKNLYHPYEKHIEFMIKAYNDILDSQVSRYVTSIAHPFDAVCCPYDNRILLEMIDDDTYKRLFDKTAKKGIGIEINISSVINKTNDEILNMEQMRMFAIAKECGCKFTFGSDSHNRNGHDKYTEHCSLAADFLGLTEKDIHEYVAEG